MTKKNRRLERNQENAVISGVLAGISDYFGQDPVLFRVIAITFLLLTGIFPGLLFYLAAWIIMPKKNNQRFDYEVVE